MSAITAVQLKDGAGNYLQAQYYDPVSDTYKPGDPSTTGIPMVPTVAASALTSSLILSPNVCKLFGLNVCASTVAGYAMLFNAKTVPDDGPVAPVRVWPLSINTGLEIGFASPLRMTQGAVVVFSSTGPFVLTKSPTAAISGEVV